MKRGKGQGPKDQYWHQERAIDAKENRNCGQCDFNYQKMEEIMSHVRNTEGHTPYCAHCDSKFSNYRNYGCHVRKFHLENRLFTCEDCGKISKTKERHLLHWNYAHKIENSYCDYCGLKCLNKSKTRQHMIYCKKYHPILAIADTLAKKAVTEVIEAWCDELPFEYFVEWREKVNNDILENLLQGECEDQINPVEVGNRAKVSIDSLYFNSDLVIKKEGRISKMKLDCIEKERMNEFKQAGIIDNDTDIADTREAMWKEIEEQSEEDFDKSSEEIVNEIDKIRRMGCV